MHWRSCRPASWQTGPGTIAGATLSLLMNLSAGVGALMMWSRGKCRSFEIVLLGSVVYGALLLITGPTNYTLFAIHVDAPAIALMLWGVIFMQDGGRSGNHLLWS